MINVPVVFYTILLLHLCYVPKIVLFVGMILFLSYSLQISSRHKGSLFYNKPIVKKSMVFVLLALCFDNFMTFQVQYIAQHANKHAEPLFDYGRKNMLKLFHFFMLNDEIQTFRQRININFVILFTFLAAFLKRKTSRTKSDEHPWRNCARVAYTIGLSRIIRMISYTMTIVPTQINDCQKIHFGIDELPQNFFEWIKIGVFESRSNGGCHDLIISGHATILTTMALSVSSAMGYHSFIMWALVFCEFSMNAIHKTHYSVDLWLGFVITFFIWHLTDKLPSDNQIEVPSNKKQSQSGWIFLGCAILFILGLFFFEPIFVISVVLLFANIYWDNGYLIEYISISIFINAIYKFI